MNFAVIYSKQDIAGINIAEALKEHFVPQTQILEFKKDSIYLEDIDKDNRLKNTDFVIFATRHKSEKGTPSLSLHAPGNWRNADFGGKPGKICPTSSLALKYLFQKLNENSKENPELDNYQITLECTHHGPLINKPCCFIEIGSNEKQWHDKEAAKVIAKTIADFQNFDKWKQEQKENKIKTAIAVGGPHYCPNFNKIQLSENSNISIGHIIPEYALPLSESMLKEAIAKTKEHTNLILLDWKGCGNSEQRQQITRLLNKLSLKYERTERIEK